MEKCHFEPFLREISLAQNEISHFVRNDKYLILLGVLCVLCGKTLNLPLRAVQLLPYDPA